MKSILPFFTIAISTFLLSAQSNQTSCNDTKSLVTKTINAINQKDTAAYKALLDFKTFIKVLKEESLRDTSLNTIYNKFSTRPELFTKMHLGSFIDLIDKINGKLTTNNWELKLHDFEIENKEESAVTHLSLLLKIEVGSKKYHIRMYVSEYQNCAYIFEPWEPNFNSGW